MNSFTVNQLHCMIANSNTGIFYSQIPSIVGLSQSKQKQENESLTKSVMIATTIIITKNQRISNIASQLRGKQTRVAWRDELRAGAPLFARNALVLVEPPLQLEILIVCHLIGKFALL
jgi:hypothetical protein